MDFFAAQDLARRNSRRLVGWFALAVIGIVASVYLALAIGLGLGASATADARPVLWDPQLFAVTALVVGSFILLASLFKTLSLARGGGATIARELGGRLVARASNDPLERRLINVVDEMAIASGVPVPAVYVLDAEQGINAFAAGARSTDGVVAVTRGALEQLSRDELQGVIAHEFSHILNGDMRLNLRLIGVLHGILLLTLAGRVLMRSARGSDRGAAPMILVGIALVVVGYIGVLFGKLIKAAVSRQREYLADAAAVQFTRNPDGIAGALKRIAGIGSTIRHPRAEEASHMFFGSGGAASRLFATHPPIAERIRRLDPAFDPALAEASRARSAAAPAADAADTTTALDAGAAAAGFAASVGEPRAEHVAYTHALLERLPPWIADAVHQAGGAREVVFALLLARDTAVRERQLAELEKRSGTMARATTERVADWLREAGPVYRLPLLDLATPTLAELSDEARAQVVATVDALVVADGRTSLFEFVLRRLLHHVLDPAAQRHGGGTSSPARLKQNIARLLALLSQVGSGSKEAGRAAFEAATAIAPIEGPWDISAGTARLDARELDRILAELGATRPPFRKKLIEACATAVLTDAQVTAAEAELLRAIAKALDCPVPPQLRYASAAAPAHPADGRL